MKVGGGSESSGGSEKHIWKIFYGGDPEIGTPGTPRGLPRDKNHFFTITTHKPAYIYPNNFSRENFSKYFFGPLGPPWGTWGPYLRIPSVEYFPNVFF